MKNRSLGFTLSFATFFMIFLSAFIVGLVSAVLLRNDSVKVHSREAMAIAQSAVGAIDGDDLREALATGVKSETYAASKRIMDRVKANNNIAYLYILASHFDDNCYYYMEGYSSSNTEEMLDLGDAEPVEAHDGELFEALRTGAPTSTGIYNSVGFGQMISAYVPVTDSAGTVVGVLGVDLRAEHLGTTIVHFLVNLVLIVALFCVLAGIWMRRFIARMIDKPIQALTEASDRLAAGDVGVNVSALYNGNEIGHLAKSFDAMVRNTQSQVEVMQKLASGDLSEEVVPRSEQDTMNLAIQATLEQLSEVFARILEHARQVSGGAQELANSARDLADGAAHQASSVEKLSSTVAEIDRRTHSNMEVATGAAQLSDSIYQSALQGTVKLEQMTGAVADITEANKSIGQIIMTIDDLAFQTNILALNAAVEAARAGPHGKGFSVVAQEVRSLSARSAEAARETEALILNTVETARLGARISQETAAVFRDILQEIAENQQLVGQIVDSAQEQKDSIGIVRQEVEQITQIASQNARTSQQTAGAGAAMSARATQLEQQVSRFRLRQCDTQVHHGDKERSDVFAAVGPQS